jgi:hypothetical protein
MLIHRWPLPPQGLQSNFQPVHIYSKLHQVTIHILGRQRLINRTKIASHFLFSLFTNPSQHSFTRQYKFLSRAFVCVGDGRRGPLPRGWVWHQTTPLGMTILYHHGQRATSVPRGGPGFAFGILTLHFLAPHTPI